MWPYCLCLCSEAKFCLRESEITKVLFIMSMSSDGVPRHTTLPVMNHKNLLFLVRPAHSLPSWREPQLKSPRKGEPLEGGRTRGIWG